ncbi:hypothetical protein [Pedobacter suwonensis]|uniref:hypothetical protein n=1 Tax=Pedobacter suwonensis TaxID=332999 RepID=UPI00119E63E7|nr:hypothetical protein [Pedobacter suwonensis]
MTFRITTFFSKIFIFLGFTLMLFSCKKAKEVSQPDKLTLLKQQVSGEWELTGGVYIMYDETGKISYTEKLPFETPAPWYDFKNPETLYLSDRHGRQALAYKISISDDMVQRMDIAATDFDIAKTFDITKINETSMTWVIDQRYDHPGPGFASRVYTEYNFTKR